MTPNDETDDRCSYHGSNDILTAIERPSGKCRNNIGDEANSGKQNDIHLRMPEEPEYIVPEQRSTLYRGEIEGSE